MRFKSVGYTLLFIALPLFADDNIAIPTFPTVPLNAPVLPTEFDSDISMPFVPLLDIADLPTLITVAPIVPLKCEP
jgi:hypothetical protein